MKAVHFVTGATGFVGSNLILELLGHAEVEVYALVRASHEPSDLRLRNALRHAARAAGHGATFDHAIAERCHAVEGDVHNPNPKGFSLPHLASSGTSQLPCASKTVTPPKFTRRMSKALKACWRSRGIAGC